ncbi:tbc domain-containing protein [Cystoisospora suis]|uniref:Tbc domain-containing protein n=1 Tax=Cystoisospora suis TaxID=483139 RepID=A0A2C6KN89_9APIC|nr:tbc domain-containing protein [Cystoisospora suis]
MSFLWSSNPLISFTSLGGSSSAKEEPTPPEDATVEQSCFSPVADHESSSSSAPQWRELHEVSVGSAAKSTSHSSDRGVISSSLEQLHSLPSPRSPRREDEYGHSPRASASRAVSYDEGGDTRTSLLSEESQTYGLVHHSLSGRGGKGSGCRRGPGGDDVRPSSLWHEESEERRRLQCGQYDSSWGIGESQGMSSSRGVPCAEDKASPSPPVSRKTLVIPGEAHFLSSGSSRSRHVDGGKLSLEERTSRVTAEEVSADQNTSADLESYPSEGSRRTGEVYSSGCSVSNREFIGSEESSYPEDQIERQSGGVDSRSRRSALQPTTQHPGTTTRRFSPSGAAVPVPPRESLLQQRQYSRKQKMQWRQAPPPASSSSELCDVTRTVEEEACSYPPGPSSSASRSPGSFAVRDERGGSDQVHRGEAAQEKARVQGPSPAERAAKRAALLHELFGVNLGSGERGERKWQSMQDRNLVHFMQMHRHTFFRRLRRGVPPSHRWNAWKAVCLPPPELRCKCRPSSSFSFAYSSSALSSSTTTASDLPSSEASGPPPHHSPRLISCVSSPAGGGVGNALTRGFSGKFEGPSHSSTMQSQQLFGGLSSSPPTTTKSSSTNAHGPLPHQPSSSGESLKSSALKRGSCCTGGVGKGDSLSSHQSTTTASSRGRCSYDNGSSCSSSRERRSGRQGDRSSHPHSTRGTDGSGTAGGGGGQGEGEGGVVGCAAVLGGGDCRRVYEREAERRSNFFALIMIDVPRTFPDVEVFDKDAQVLLCRTLNAFANIHPEVGYCQGMNFIAGLLLLVSSFDEFDAFCVFRVLMQRYRLKGFFQEKFPLLRKYMKAFDTVASTQLPELRQHFADEGVLPAVYLHQWFLTLFVTSLPLRSVCVLWDFLLGEGLHGLLELAVALLKVLTRFIIHLRFEEVIKFLKSLKSSGGGCDDFKVGKMLVKQAAKVQLPEPVLMELLTADLAALTREAEEEEAAEAQTRGAVVAAAEAAAALAEREGDGEDGRSNPLVTTLTEDEEDMSENEGISRKKDSRRHHARDRGSHHGSSYSHPTGRHGEKQQQEARKEDGQGQHHRHHHDRQQPHNRKNTSTIHTSHTKAREAGGCRGFLRDRRGTDEEKMNESGHEDHIEKRKLRGSEHDEEGDAVVQDRDAQQEKIGDEQEAKTNKGENSSSALSFWTNPIATLTGRDSRGYEGDQDKDVPRGASVESLHDDRDVSSLTLDVSSWGRSPLGGGGKGTRGEAQGEEEEEMKELKREKKNHHGSGMMPAGIDRADDPRESKGMRSSSSCSPSWSSSSLSRARKNNRTDGKCYVDSLGVCTNSEGAVRVSSHSPTAKGEGRKREEASSFLDNTSPTKLSTSESYHHHDCEVQKTSGVVLGVPHCFRQTMDVHDKNKTAASAASYHRQVVDNVDDTSPTSSQAPVSQEGLALRGVGVFLNSPSSESSLLNVAPELSHPVRSRRSLGDSGEDDVVLSSSSNLHRCEGENLLHPEHVAEELDTPPLLLSPLEGTSGFESIRGDGCTQPQQTTANHVIPPQSLTPGESSSGSPLEEAKDDGEEVEGDDEEGHSSSSSSHMPRSSRRASSCSRSFRSLSPGGGASLHGLGPGVTSFEGGRSRESSTASRRQGCQGPSSSSSASSPSSSCVTCHVSEAVTSGCLDVPIPDLGSVSRDVRSKSDTRVLHPHGEDEGLANNEETGTSTGVASPHTSESPRKAGDVECLDILGTSSVLVNEQEPVEHSSGIALSPLVERGEKKGTDEKGGTSKSDCRCDRLRLRQQANYMQQQVASISDHVSGEKVSCSGSCLPSTSDSSSSRSRRHDHELKQRERSSRSSIGDGCTDKGEVLSSHHQDSIDKEHKRNEEPYRETTVIAAEGASRTVSGGDVLPRKDQQGGSPATNTTTNQRRHADDTMKTAEESLISHDEGRDTSGRCRPTGMSVREKRCASDDKEQQEDEGAKPCWRDVKEDEGTLSSFAHDRGDQHEGTRNTNSGVVHEGDSGGEECSADECLEWTQVAPCWHDPHPEFVCDGDEEEREREKAHEKSSRHIPRGIRLLTEENKSCHEEEHQRELPLSEHISSPQTAFCSPSSFFSTGKGSVSEQCSGAVPTHRLSNVSSDHSPSAVFVSHRSRSSGGGKEEGNLPDSPSGSSPSSSSSCCSSSSFSATASLDTTRKCCSEMLPSPSNYSPEIVARRRSSRVSPGASPSLSPGMSASGESSQKSTDQRDSFLPPTASEPSSSPSATNTCLGEDLVSHALSPSSNSDVSSPHQTSLSAPASRKDDEQVVQGSASLSSCSSSSSAFSSSTLCHPETSESQHRASSSSLTSHPRRGSSVSEGSVADALMEPSPVPMVHNAAVQHARSPPLSPYGLATHLSLSSVMSMNGENVQVWRRLKGNEEGEDNMTFIGCERFGSFIQGRKQLCLKTSLRGSDSGISSGGGCASSDRRRSEILSKLEEQKERMSVLCFHRKGEGLRKDLGGCDTVWSREEERRRKERCSFCYREAEQRIVMLDRRSSDHSCCRGRRASSDDLGKERRGKKVFEISGGMARGWFSLKKRDVDMWLARSSSSGSCRHKCAMVRDESSSVEWIENSGGSSLEEENRRDKEKIDDKNDRQLLRIHKKLLKADSSEEDHEALVHSYHSNINSPGGANVSSRRRFSMEEDKRREDDKHEKQRDEEGNGTKRSEREGQNSLDDSSHAVDPSSVPVTSLSLDDELHVNKGLVDRRRIETVKEQENGECEDGKTSEKQGDSSSSLHLSGALYYVEEEGFVGCNLLTEEEKKEAMKAAVFSSLRRRSFLGASCLTSCSPKSPSSASPSSSSSSSVSSPCGGGNRSEVQAREVHLSSTATTTSPLSTLHQSSFPTSGTLANTSERIQSYSSERGEGSEKVLEPKEERRKSRGSSEGTRNREGGGGGRRRSGGGFVGAVLRLFSINKEAASSTVRVSSNSREGDAVRADGDPSAVQSATDSSSS